MTTKETQSVESRNPDTNSGLGILGCKEMFDRNYVMSEEVFEKENNGEEKNQPQQASVNPSKTETVNDVEPASMKAISEVHEILEGLLAEWCRAILNENKTFKNCDEFLSKLVEKAYLSIPDPGWMNMVPRNASDCKKLLKKLGLYERYMIKLNSGILLREAEKRESIMRTRMHDPYTHVVKSNERRVRKVPLLMGRQQMMATVD